MGVLEHSTKIKVGTESSRIFSEGFLLFVGYTGGDWYGVRPIPSKTNLYIEIVNAFSEFSVNRALRGEYD